MENKASKGSLYINGDRTPIADIYFLDKDRDILRSLLCSGYPAWSLVPESIHFPELVPGPLELYKNQGLQFVYKLTTGSDRTDRLSLKLLGAEQETIYEGGEIYELLTKDNRFFTSKLIDKPIHSFKVKAISEMERIEKLLKGADLQLSPEQEVKLLRKIVEEQQVIINNLKGI